MRLEHARHNADACDFLNTSGNYNDWVITTAFYSAMHFVQYKIFPLSINTVNYNTLSDYYRLISGNMPARISKHEAIKKLVSRELPVLNRSYRRLFDLCHTARYVDYQSSSRITTEARNHLNSIRSFCEPK